jgi:hypothetical protein
LFAHRVNEKRERDLSTSRPSQRTAKDREAD